MTKLAAFCLLLSGLCSVQAQQQERKLVDRIMEPDMSLQSAEQNKKFKADKSSVDRRAAVNTFYVAEKTKPERFSQTRQFSSESYNAQTFDPNSAGKASDPLHQDPAASKSYPLPTDGPRPRTVSDQKKTQASRDYAGNRPYLEQGKSQKSLSRKNSPLTIDQVRDLLNKNK